MYLLGNLNGLILQETERFRVKPVYGLLKYRIWYIREPLGRYYREPMYLLGNLNGLILQETERFPVKPVYGLLKYRFGNGGNGR